MQSVTRAFVADIGRRFAADREGVTSLEYGLMGAFVFLVIIAGVTGVGTKLMPVFSTIANAL